MDDPLKTATTFGKEKIQRWENALAYVERLKRDQIAAEAELKCAINDLGRWSVPGDAKSGEVFNIAIGTAYLEVTTNSDEFWIEWRNGVRPKQ